MFYKNLLNLPRLPCKRSGHASLFTFQFKTKKGKDLQTQEKVMVIIFDMLHANYMKNLILMFEMSDWISVSTFFSNYFYSHLILFEPTSVPRFLPFLASGNLLYKFVITTLKFCSSIPPAPLTCFELNFSLP